MGLRVLSLRQYLHSPQNDFFNIVEKVELLSSSRVISTLTKVEILWLNSLIFLPIKLAVIAENLLKPQAVKGVLPDQEI
jgi:hypothetical protein